MRSSASSHKSIVTHLPRTSARNDSRHSSSTNLDTNTEEDLLICPGLKSTLTRKWSSLEDHAEHVREVLVQEEHTPRPVDRREGFMWEIPSMNESLIPQVSRILPAPVASSMSRSGAPAFQTNVVNEEPPSQPSLDTWSTHSGSGEDISRKDTIQSSSSSLARGVLRTGPDMRMFNDQSYHAKQSWQPSHIDEHPREQSRLRYIPSSKPKLAQQKINTDRWPTSSIADKLKIPPKSQGPDLHKSGLKDRRNLDHSAALKLTLPILSARQRMHQTSDFTAMQDFRPPRPRSPKTPWPRESCPSPSVYYAVPAIKTATPDLLGGGIPNTNFPVGDLLRSSQSQPHISHTRRVRDRCYITRPRYSRTRSGTSESSLAKTPDGATSPLGYNSQTPYEELRQLGRRSRHKRWGGPWSTNTEPATPELPTHEPNNARFSLVRFLSPRRHKRSSHAISPGQAPQIDKAACTKPLQPQQVYRDVVASMATPPTFIPPGLHRIPTPPQHDRNGELKGQLADFNFELPEIQRAKRSPNVPCGGWDSDALLMSQKSGVTPSSTSSNGSPQGPLSHLPTPTDFARLSSSGYITSPSNIISEPIVKERGWFRVPIDAGDSPGDRAKFEWLIPEHLPTSPLCPLHSSYRGISKGYCVFHGPQLQIEREYRDYSHGTQANERMDYLAVGKRRRLASLSSP